MPLFLGSRILVLALVTKLENMVSHLVKVKPSVAKENVSLCMKSQIRLWSYTIQWIYIELCFRGRDRHPFLTEPVSYNVPGYSKVILMLECNFNRHIGCVFDCNPSDLGVARTVFNWAPSDDRAPCSRIQLRSVNAPSELYSFGLIGPSEPGEIYF